MESHGLVQTKTMALLSTQAKQQVSAINRMIGNMEKEHLRSQLADLIRSTLSENLEFIGIRSFWEPNKIDGADRDFVDNAESGSNETGRFAFNIYFDDQGNLIENTTSEFLVEAFVNVAEGADYSAYSCSIVTGNSHIFGSDELEIDIDFNTGYTINIATASISIFNDGDYAGNTGIDLSIDKLSNLLSESNHGLYQDQGKMTIIGSFNKTAGDSTDTSLSWQSLGNLWSESSAWVNKVLQSGGLAINLDDASSAYYIVLPFEPIVGTDRWSILYNIPKSAVLAVR